MKIYFYPIEDKTKSSTQNPYTLNLINSLEKNCLEIINKDNVSKIGILNILKYFLKIDIVFLNWIEDLPERRFGFLQNIFFFILLLMCKISRKKIIWVMHNKISHSKKFLFLKIINNYLLINYSDFIITHSSEGIDFAKTFTKSKKDNIFFKHHPMIVRNIKLDSNTEKDFDILIWGTISPYKGIDNFLEFLKKESLLDKFSIKIVGKITNDELSSKLNSFRSKNILIDDNFIDRTELIKLIEKSKFILFTYSGYSTLSSGALIDTLELKANIIGPNVGAFKDLKKEKLIYTYENYNDIINLINSFNNNIYINNNIDEFISNNTWNKFADFVKNIFISRKNDK